MKTRMMSVAGSFYPSKPDEIKLMIDRFNTILESHRDLLGQYSALRGNALIVPHAGWIYSGFTANIAYRLLGLNNLATLVVIGPSHRVGFEGMSIAETEVYQTPLGDILIDSTLTQKLIKTFSLPYLPNAHHEHSTEVQMPFIKHYLPHASVVEVVYSHTSPSHIEPIISYCLQQPSTAVIISTDLSHYYSLENAKRLDSICLESIKNNNVAQLHEGCEACGIIGVEAMLNVARSQKLKSTIVDYRTSADASGDSDRVVGYASVVFT